MSKVREMLRNWLGVKDLPDKLKKEVVEAAQEAFKTDMDYWNGVFKSIGEIECSFCGKKIVTYPFGGGYYREFDGSVICSNDCLNNRKNAQLSNVGGELTDKQLNDYFDKMNVTIEMDEFGQPISFKTKPTNKKRAGK